MYSHVPQTLTIAGRVRYAFTESMGVALFTKTYPAMPFTWMSVGAFNSDMANLNVIGNGAPFPNGYICRYRNMPDNPSTHILPAVFKQGYTLLHLSTCSNAVFLAPVDLLFPVDTLLTVSCRCTLINNQVLGANLDLLTCFVYDNSMQEGLLCEGFPTSPAGLNMHRMMPCYRIDTFRVAMPEPSKLFNAFAFTETSHLDAMAIVAQSNNATRPTSTTAAITENELGPLPHSAVGGMPNLMQPIREHYPFATESEDNGRVFSYRELCDMAETMGLDGRYVRAAGLRGVAERNTLTSQLLSELMVRRVKYPESDHIVGNLVSNAISSIMYWTLTSRAMDHPLCHSDVHGTAVRIQLHEVAYTFFAQPDMAVRCDNALTTWREFLVECSVSRYLYPWLSADAVNTPSLELQQVLVDTFLSMAREMVPETLDKLYRAAILNGTRQGAPDTIDAEQFAADPRFGFHRSALKLYLDRLVDKTRSRPARRDRVKRLAEIQSNMQTRVQQQLLNGDILDVDDIVPDSENPAASTTFTAGNSGNKDEDEPVHDANYYARRGAHGNGHLYLKAVATDSPFGDNGGRMWKWCSRDADNILAPIVVDQDPSGRPNIDLRVTARHDHDALMFLSEQMKHMGERFYGMRNGLRDLITANRTRVFSDKSTIELSDKSKLTLSDEQMELFDQLTKEPITAIKGGGGVGKSTLIAALLTVFSGSTSRPAEQLKPSQLTPDGTAGNLVRTAFVEWLWSTPVALVMAYGKVASNFMRKYGMFASTVHLAAAHLNGDFFHDDRIHRPPSASIAKAQVVIVDEITVQSLSHFTMLFNAFPEMSKLIVVGDINQMSCIERGAIGDALVNLTDEHKDMSVRLTHNYRLTNQSGDDTQLEARTHIAFNAIIAGSVVNGDKRIFGPYSDTGRAADLPAICELPSWDPALVKRALKRAPLLLLPHVDINKGALGSLKATCDALIQVVGSKPQDWENVQVLSQRRREEVGPITAHISEKLFGQELPKTRQGFLPPSDLCPGEKAVFKRRVRALAPNGSPCYIYTNDMRIIDRIEDADEVVLNAKDRRRRQTIYRNHVTRKSTRAYVPGAVVHPGRVRIITFKDGYRVVVPYKTPVAYQEIDFLRRGLCVTNASMQGSAANLVVTYIRPEVSHTLDRRQLYTSVSRMEQSCIIVGSRETLEKVARQAPQARNDHCIEFIRRAFEAWKDICPQENDADADAMKV